jgi:hypothetical protein
VDCRILRQITLKSDGHLACDDSRGYKIDLGRVDLARGWQIRRVLSDPIYSHVRSSFREGRLPWPGVCENCDLLSDRASPVDRLDSHLDLLVEPTLACGLSCACCPRKQILARGRNTSSLDVAVLGRLAEACAQEGLVLGEVNYAGQGEPLLHDNFRALFDAVKAPAPQASQVVTTTGNVDFRSTVGEAALDRLVVSCDGCRQEPYRRYRVGGDWPTVLKFMRHSKRYGHPQTYVEWKYILFEFNDSDEDLIRAQNLADDLGVDSLLFIVTNSKWHSTRFTVDNMGEIPLRSPVARVSPAAAMNVAAFSSRPLTPVPGGQAAFGHIDLCSVSVGKVLRVEGWAYGSEGEPSERVELWLDGRAVASTRAIHRRSDVAAVHPAAAGANCGFIFEVPVDTTALPSLVEVLVHGRSGVCSLGGLTAWELPAAHVKRRSDLPAQQLISPQPVRIVRAAAVAQAPT